MINLNFSHIMKYISKKEKEKRSLTMPYYRAGEVQAVLVSVSQRNIQNPKIATKGQPKDKIS